MDNNNNNIYGQYPGTPYPMPYEPPQPVAKPKEKPEYSKAELVLSAFVFIAAFFFVRFVIFHATGFITTGLFIAVITAAIIYMKKRECSFSGYNKLLTVVFYLFTAVFSITANNFIKTLDVLFLFCGIAYLVYSVGADNKGVERYLPFALTKAVFGHPFSGFTKQTDIAQDSLSDSKTATNIKYIIIGLLITIPLTLVVAGLLMSADDGVEKMLTGIVNRIFSEEIWNVFIQLALALPFSLYLFGMFYTNTHRKDIKELDPNVCKFKIYNMRFVSNLVVYTAVTPICILYVLFFISQANYFLSAFSGSLPSLLHEPALKKSRQGKALCAEVLQHCHQRIHHYPHCNSHEQDGNVHQCLRTHRAQTLHKLVHGSACHSVCNDNHKAVPL